MSQLYIPVNNKPSLIDKKLLLFAFLVCLILL
jgi:hypothetical protein